MHVLDTLYTLGPAGVVDVHTIVPFGASLALILLYISNKLTAYCEALTRCGALPSSHTNV